MTEDELKAIEARANAAAPGPWVWDADSYDVRCGDDDIVIGGDDVGRLYFAEGTLPFILCSREDVPALIAEVRELKSEVLDLSYDIGELRDADCSDEKD